MDHRTLIVAGGGPSIRGFAIPSDVPVLAVNDAMAHMRGRRPDYLFLQNPILHFAGERMVWISHGAEREVFACKRHGDLPFIREHFNWPNGQLATMLRLGRYRDTDALRVSRAVGYSETSAYAACLIAEHLGAQRIALLGVDLVGHRVLEPITDQVDTSFRRLRGAMAARGVELVTLSDETLLHSIPRGDLSPADMSAPRSDGPARA